MWVVANLHYSRVLKQIAPLEGQLNQLKGELSESQGRLQQCQEELLALDEQVCVCMCVCSACWRHWGAVVACVPGNVLQLMLHISGRRATEECLDACHHVANTLVHRS